MKKKLLNPKENAARRLKIVRGHLGKIIEMVEADAYCVDILQQTAAVKSAIKKAEEVLLANHINHCVAKAVNTKGESRVITELTQLFGRQS